MTLSKFNACNFPQKFHLTIEGTSNLSIIRMFQLMFLIRRQKSSHLPPNQPHKPSTSKKVEVPERKSAAAEDVEVSKKSRIGKPETVIDSKNSVLAGLDESANNNSNNLVNTSDNSVNDSGAKRKRNASCSSVSSLCSVDSKINKCDVKEDKKKKKRKHEEVESISRFPPTQVNT